jgi:4-hydroxy-tetrahydrodipicolinate reductase
MKIALIGYGKMGQAIEKLAQKKGHQIILRVDNKSDLTSKADTLQNADVAIEFTEPDQAKGNIKFCLELGVPVVSGTTGWLKDYDSVKEYCNTKQGAFFYSTNYSIGVNLFFAMNEKLASLMEAQPQYDEVLIQESHHIEKLDSPSGTAITLAEQMIQQISRFNRWVNYRADENVNLGGDDDEGELPIFSTREGDVPGTHIVKYFSDVDEIEIIHKALTRTGFAQGALAAAEWIIGRRGVYGMKDLLNL